MAYGAPVAPVIATTIRLGRLAGESWSGQKSREWRRIDAVFDAPKVLVDVLGLVQCCRTRRETVET